MVKSAPGSPKKPLILTGITAALCLFIVIYIQSTSESTLNRYLPWVDASTNIKFEVTMAHLWLEEYLSGDPAVKLNTVDYHLNQAEQFITAMLDGRITKNQAYKPLKDPVLRKQVNKLLYKLVAFNKLTQQRIASDTKNGAGSNVDQQYDAVFRALIQDINTLENNLLQHIRKEKISQDSSIFLLLLTICTMTGISMYSIGRFAHSRARYLRKLSDANKRISEQNAQLLKSSQTDQLTGLPNRQMLETMAKQILARVQRGKTAMSLTFIDLDFFKPINDQFGHSVGDKVLVRLTETIQSHLREDDMLARLAGDEFILIVQDQNAETLRTSVERVLGRINQCLAQPIISYPLEVHIRFSAGTAIAPEQAVDFDELLHLADQAMYESKKQGRGQHHFYCDQAVSPMPAIAELIPLSEQAVAIE